MELTEPSPYKNQKVSGYMLNAALSKENQQHISEIVGAIKANFGKLILEQPAHALHITLMDWVAPLVTYDKDHDSIFEEVFPEYDEALLYQTERIRSFKIHFDTITVSRAAIFITARDDGQFQQVRDGFVGEVDLLPGTKQPPTIVHCTIARFDEEVDVAPIRRFVDSLIVDFEQPVDSFRLVHETEMPMVKYEILKDYRLPL